MQTININESNITCELPNTPLVYLFEATIITLCGDDVGKRTVYVLAHDEEGAVSQANCLPESLSKSIQQYHSFDVSDAIEKAMTTVKRVPLMVRGWGQSVY
jgi:hypothetical protein